MSDLINDTMIQEAMETAQDMYENTGDRSYVHTMDMYLEDGDLEAAFQYLQEMKLTIRAHNDVAHQSSLEIY